MSLAIDPCVVDEECPEPAVVDVLDLRNPVGTKAIKPILQSEASECGLASLAMVAAAHGKHIGLAELRRRFPLSLKGARLSHIVQVAQRIGLKPRALRLDLHDLPNLSLPCILHWDLNHFVVLTRVKGDRVTIVDPAFGERVVRHGELSDRFTGVALELAPDRGFERTKPTPAVTLRELTGPIRGLLGSLTQIIGLSLALQIFVVLSPFFMQWVVDQVLVSADRDLLWVLGAGFCLTLVLQVAIAALRGWTVVHLSSMLGLQWMGNVFAHLLRLPLEFFEKRHLGDITSRIGSVQSIQRTLTTSFVESIVDGLMAAVTLLLMVLYSVKLACITIGAVAIYLGLRALAFRTMRETTEKQLVAVAKQQTHLIESLRGMQSIKLAGHEAMRRAAYENLMVDTVGQDVRLARLSLGFSSASQFVFGLERIVVIWIGATLALESIFSVGMLVAYLAYKDQFASRVGALIDRWIEFRMLRLHGERLADIVTTAPEESPANLVDLRLPDRIGIEVRDLSFRYAEGEPWVIKDCSFSVLPGESVALVGASGCGKTTLVKLLLGLLTPTSGSVHIGGHDLHRVGAGSIRSVIGAVMQDDQLFAGSVADNITFFDPDATPERVEEAARLAAVHDDIVAMPMGYHSLIGDMGSSLSGGQKQRVILARALYRAPKLLVLDEATSHLDVTRERIVNDAVRRLDLTKVIVAHRPETIASADRVLVLEAGRIVRDAALQRPAGIPASAQVAV